MPPKSDPSPKPRLPVKQLFVLSICRFAEPLALTSIFPYLPALISSFGVSTSDIAFWAGLTSSTFSITQCISALPWGRLSDHLGRKPAILLGLANTLVTTLIWGLARDLPTAITARALMGAGNGNTGIIRTVVAELCPWKELQPRAFSVMPIVFNVGAVVGPAIGSLANPLGRKFGDEGNEVGNREGAVFVEAKEDSVWWRFPFLLPNVIIMLFFVIGLTVGILFLEESIEGREGRRDFGLVLGEKLIVAVHNWISWIKRVFTRNPKEKESETEPLLNGGERGTTDSYATLTAADEESLPNNPNHSKPQASSSSSQINTPPPLAKTKIRYRDIFTRQTTLNLVVYTLLATHNMAFDQLIAILLHHPKTGPSTTPFAPPLRFVRGFGLPTSTIGMLFTMYGVAGIVYQFVFFAPVTFRLGALLCLRLAFFVTPVIYFLIPFVVLIPGQTIPLGLLFALWLVKGLGSSFSFPCSTILLTNSVASMRLLATVNGIATAIGAVGRAVGPWASGAIFTGGVNAGFVIAPFWFLGLIATVAAVPVCWLVENEGFGDTGAGEGDSTEAGSETAEEVRLEEAATIEDRNGESREAEDDAANWADDEFEFSTATLPTPRGKSPSPSTPPRVPPRRRSHSHGAVPRAPYDGGSVFEESDTETSSFDGENFHAPLGLQHMHSAPPRRRTQSSASARRIRPAVSHPERVEGERRESQRVGRRRSRRWTNAELAPIGLRRGFRRMSSNLGASGDGWGTGGGLGG